MFLQQPQGKIQEEVRTRDAAVGRRDTTTTWTKVKLTRLPRPDVMRDASTPGVAETPESDVPQAYAATRSRSRHRLHLWCESTTINPVKKNLLDRRAEQWNTVSR